MKDSETGPPEEVDPREREALAEAYKGDYIVLMPRDPEWLHAYWDIPNERYEAALAELGATAETAETVLRVHNVTDLIDPKSGRPQLDKSEDYLVIKVDPSADHWYIKAGAAKQLYCVEYMVAAPDGRSVSLALSNLAATPADRVSEVNEETWVTASPEEGDVTKTRGPAETKWINGQEEIHEALSSAESANFSAEPPSTGPRP